MILDFQSNTCFVVQRGEHLIQMVKGARFNTHGGNILMLDNFCFHVEKPVMSILPFSPIL